MPPISKQFPIVGVGASAGGIEALEAFFKGIPAKPGMAFIVITHLSPDRDSHLMSIIKHYTSLDVLTASDGMTVEPDHVYVLPQGAILTIERNKLKIEKLAPDQRPRKPIDVFLGSLARDQGHYAVSIILSGSDGDGALGTKAVKEAGGLTMAQVADSHGPEHPEMPSSAIATGHVDFAVPAGEMGTRLLQTFCDADDLRAASAELTGQDQEASLEAARIAICNIIRDQLGHDFGGYKVKTFLRRVHRRMQVCKSKSVNDYLQLLRDKPEETRSLFRDLLINVTSFFRDKDAFERLAQTVIPKLFDQRSAHDVVRIWVPGCSTGEEVFSLAILLREHMEKLQTVPRVQIFATDIDEAALNIARDGRYPEALLTAVSPERKKKYFYRDAGSFVVTNDIRDLCIFSSHSLIRDPPFSRIDLVSCRNLLIYLGSEVQSDVIPVFHYSLRPGGYLFLGMAENISQFEDLFTPVDRQHRIFRSRDGAVRRPRVPLNVYTRHLSSSPLAKSFANALPGIGSLKQVIESQVLERHSPAYLAANAEGEVVYFSSGTGSYLESPAGSPTRSLFDLARKGIRSSLMLAFREAVDWTRSATQVGFVPKEEAGTLALVDVTVEPIWGQNREDRLFLVVFKEQKNVPLEQDGRGSITKATIDSSAQLQHEMHELKRSLQVTVEEYETSLEELRSTNEELISVNEELQSTNEELEASKEEQQSVNEELQTVNSELNAKIEALDVANSDLRNLFDNTQIAIIFLDRNLTIRSFTPAITRVFNILPVDRGRSIRDLASRIDVSGLEADIQSALTESSAVEREMRDPVNSIHYLVKSNPYHSLDGSIEGVVITFVDVTRLTEAEAKQEKLQAALIESQKMQAVAQLTGAMAHDFNNLLHVILMKCEVLELQRPDDTLLLEKLSAIRIAIQTGRQIIQSLLAVAQQQPLRMNTMDVRQVIDDNLEILKSAVGPNIKIEYKRFDDPLIVMADNAALASAILNLAMNARDAMPHGGQLTISCSSTLIDTGDPMTLSHGLKIGEYAEITISDTGAGMSPEVMRRAFEPFFSTKERGKGTGLGLSGVDGLCRQLHGAASLRNADKGGLIVRLLIPLSTTKTHSKIAPPSRNELRQGQHLKILIVDDDFSVAGSTRDLLSLYGHSVIVANAGDEALAKLKQDNFDFMLCDINMPIMLGPEVAAAAELIQPKLNIALMTGFDERPTDKFKWRILEKPINPTALLDILNQITPIA